MRAVGAYLRALRENQGLSQGKLAEMVGVAGNTIWRIEAGKQEPRADALAAILTAVHGRIEHIQELISSDVATLIDGERLAQERLVELQKIPPSELDRIMSDLRSEAERDPSLLRFFRRLLSGDRLSRDGDS